MARLMIREKYRVKKSGIVLHNFSSAAAWVGGGTTRTDDATIFKEGTQSVKFSGTTVGSRSELKNINFDLSAGGTLKFRVYCENLALNSSVESRFSVNATGVSGSNATISWNRNELNNGWNELVANIPNGNVSRVGGIAAWTFSGTTTDFNTPMQSMSLDLSGQGVGDFWFDSLEFGAYTRPNVVIGFDAVDSNHVATVMPYMRNYGMVGYIALQGGSFNSPITANSQALYDNGWDIIGHTVTHARLGDLTTAQQIIDEVQPNLDAISAAGWPRGIKHFAYPQSSFSDLAVATLGSMGLHSARAGTSPFISMSQYGWLNPHLHGSLEMNNLTSLAQAKDRIDDAIILGVSINIFGHQIGAVADSLTWTTADFEALMDYIYQKKQQGLIDTLSLPNWFDQLEKPMRSGI